MTTLTPYLCIVLGLIGFAVAQRIENRKPNISNGEGCIGVVAIMFSGLGTGIGVFLLILPHLFVGANQ